MSQLKPLILYILVLLAGTKDGDTLLCTVVNASELTAMDVSIDHGN